MKIKSRNQSSFGFFIEKLSRIVALKIDHLEFKINDRNL